jgi:copper chaperone
MKRVTLQVQGMSCGHCVHAVTEALAGVPGVRVEAVQVGSATVELDENLSGVGALIDAIDDVGYSAAEAVA